jgi:hypothetical protein
MLGRLALLSLVIITTNALIVNDSTIVPRICGSNPSDAQIAEVEAHFAAANSFNPNADDITAASRTINVHYHVRLTFMTLLLHMCWLKYYPECRLSTHPWRNQAATFRRSLYLSFTTLFESSLLLGTTRFKNKSTSSTRTTPILVSTSSLPLVTAPSIAYGLTAPALILLNKTR